MAKRFVCIWFRYLNTDWYTRRHHLPAGKPLVLASPDHGKMMITAANAIAEKEGIVAGMAVADARVIDPGITIADNNAAPLQLLTRFAKWFIRYSPVVSVDMPCGLILDITGCAHLWGGEKEYLTDIYRRLKDAGYSIHIAIADTIGAAWAVTRTQAPVQIVETGKQYEALLSLPSAALRLETDTAALLEKLGLRQVASFINIPRTAIRRRFGQHMLQRLDEALGNKEELIVPVIPVVPYMERLPCIEPISTRTGISIALEKLLDALCGRLQNDGKGLRSAVFKSYRVDGKMEAIAIGTTSPCCRKEHLFKLFENKIETIDPALGIELFTLEAPETEKWSPSQARFWDAAGVLTNNEISELLDRIESKMGANHIERFVPAQHYWPERSFAAASSINEPLQSAWKKGKPRPLKILPMPELIKVTAPIPDYPPMMFHYKGALHKIIKADGPERIEKEWWIEEGQHRDYYVVEDEQGQRYWLFRSGHYDAAKTYDWFIHGFFA